MKAQFIPKSREINTSLDYFKLRSLGIKYIQELTGAFWTDYNEHDPGVTILEQLCYALTDLAYKANFDIEDHLFNSKGKDQAFFKPQEILPCNPVTPNDYRKVILDSQFEIKNVWFVPVGKNSNSINGLYKIYLDIDPSIKTEEEKNKVVENVKKQYSQFRNLSEDVEEIIVLENFEVQLFADVEVDGIRDIEAILADIYYHAYYHLSPEVKFSSLQELLDEEVPLHEIFNGPLLKHGFIKNESLHGRIKKILISDIIKIIMQIPGVISVKNLFLKIDGEVYDNMVALDDKKLPKLVTKVVSEEGDQNIKFFKGNVNYSAVDPLAVARELNEKQSTHSRVYRLNEEDVELKQGKHLDLQYFSIQEQFPTVYGIGREGIPGKPDVKRKAQAKQLKSYLLLFEQLMVNYLAQLSNAKSLFSLNTELSHTYFSKSLKGDVPGAEELLFEEDKSIEDLLLVEGKLPLDYEQGLDKLVTQGDDFIDRRNRFLDYLLAVHGESFTQYSLSQFNYYYTEEEFENQLIVNKTRLLKSLSFINKDRAKGFDYTEDTLNTSNIPGLAVKLSALLGLHENSDGNELGYKVRPLTQPFDNLGLELIDESQWKRKRRTWEKWTQIEDEKATDNWLKKHFDYIDDEDYSLEKIEEAEQNRLLNLTTIFKGKLLSPFFLRVGISLDRYRVGKLHGGDVYSLLFLDEEGWLKLGDFSSEEEASKAAVVVQGLMKSLNITSEGMHLIEHLLIRPDVSDKRFGIYLCDENGEPFLRSVGQFTFERRLEILSFLEDEIFQYGNYSVEITKEKDFEVRFTTAQDTIEFVSLKANESVEYSHEQMEKLYNYLSNQNRLNGFEEKVDYYIRHDEKVNIVPENFFSNRVSIVLPEWTARFKNKEFRSIAEEIMKNQIPASVSPSFLWLSPGQAQAFEKLYFEWLEKRKRKNTSLHALDDLNNDLTQLLMKLSES